MTCFVSLPTRSVPVLCVLAGILCLSIAPVASGFMSLQQQRLGPPDTIMIDKVHKGHWTIHYSYGDSCPAEERNNDAALTAAVTEALQTWLQPLREYTDHPIVNDFRYKLSADWDAADFGITFHCDLGLTAAFVFDGRSPGINLHRSKLEVEHPGFMPLLVHEVGHIFGLADTYVRAKDIGKPGFSKGGLDSTKGTQPAAAMSGGMFGRDDKNGIVWLYKVSSRWTFNQRLLLQLTTSWRIHRSGVCRNVRLSGKLNTVSKSTNIRSSGKLNTVSKSTFFWRSDRASKGALFGCSEEDENLDLNARDADGMTALHHAFINEYMQVVEALLSFEDIDVNVRGAKGFTALHHAVLLNDLDRATEVVERLLEHPKIRVNIRRNDGRTPAQLARDIGRFQFTKLIWEHPTAKLPPWSVTSAGKLTTTWGHLKKQD